MNPYGDGFSEQQKKITTLTPFLELDTWTPLMASLLVCGIQPPPNDCIDIPTAAMGLDGVFITGKEDAFHVARWVLELWNSREDALAKVRPADFVAWCKTKSIPTHWLSEIDNVPPEQDTATPAPLTTNEIANCFVGLREWDVTRWKRELGSPDVWLKACQHRKGTRGRGGYESTWFPVQIAVALVKQDQKSARTLRARFKKQEPLQPWFDVFEINIPDDSDSQ